MRIGLVSTLATLVRKIGAGSVEGLVWLLAAELTRLGHDVTLFAAEGSDAPCERVITVPGVYKSPGMPTDYQQCELLNIRSALLCAKDLDVLHVHAYLLGLVFQGLTSVRMVHTLHTQPYENEAALLRACGEKSTLTAPSTYQWSAYPQVRPSVIPHGLDPNDFPFSPHPAQRLCFLGRFLPGKGPVRAVKIARRLDIPILLAGPANDYFREVVQPLVDGVNVQYVGPVNGEGRRELLGGSLALIYPNVQGEPFGLVMVEAMLCGTPVIAADVGAAPEVVTHGTTGVTGPVDRLADLAPQAIALDRRLISQHASSAYCATRMASDYAAVYAREL